MLNNEGPFTIFYCDCCGMDSTGKKYLGWRFGGPVKLCGKCYHCETDGHVRDMTMLYDEWAANRNA